MLTRQHLPVYMHMCTCALFGTLPLRKHAQLQKFTKNQIWRLRDETLHIAVPFHPLAPSYDVTLSTPSQYNGPGQQYYPESNQPMPLVYLHLSVQFSPKRSLHILSQPSWNLCNEYINTHHDIPSRMCSIVIPTTCIRAIVS